MSRNTWWAAYELRRLERMWLPSAHASPLERVLAYEPACFEGGRQQHYRIAALCRELGLRPPWTLHLPKERWLPEWHARKPWPYPNSGANPFFLENTPCD
jgi:hypothetical protein